LKKDTFSFKKEDVPMAAVSDNQRVVPLAFTVHESPFCDNLRLRVHTSTGIAFKSSRIASPDLETRPPSPRPESPYTPIEPSPSPPPFNLEEELDAWQEKINSRARAVERFQIEREPLLKKKENLNDAITRLAEQIEPIATYISSLKDTPKKTRRVLKSPSKDSPPLSQRVWVQVNLGDKMDLCQRLLNEMKELEKIFLKICAELDRSANELRAASRLCKRQEHEEGLEILKRGLVVWVNQSSSAENQRARIEAERRIIEAYERPLTSLDLDELCLGELPSEIVILHRLTSLSVRNNQLTELPSLFMRMDQLRRLYLSRNLFEHISLYLPPNLTHLGLVGNPVVSKELEIGALQVAKDERFTLYV
jgi:Leucine-rich repeat (LRR) protein